MKNRRPSSSLVIAVTLFIAACVLGVLVQSREQTPIKVPRARYADATPLGGKGLRLLLERLNYRTRVESGVLPAMPQQAKVWLILDYQTGFSARESTQLLKWVKNGGTLIWAATPRERSVMAGNFSALNNTGMAQLRRELKIKDNSENFAALFQKNSDALPALTPLNPGTVSEVWSGVSKAQGSGGGLQIHRAYNEIAGSPLDTQLAEVPLGKGRVFIASDALLFTNYALSKPDNAVLISNLVRLHAPNGALVVFDERHHGENEAEKIEESWLYYLWRPPLRYAVIQLFLAAILAAILYGRRLGAPVPLPDSGPVTRASQWAGAMGALFQKVGRPRAAGEIIGEDFRRQLTRRLGLSITDDDELIAARAAEASGFPARAIDRLLLQAKVPDGNEAQTLHDAQEMEKILRRLDQR
jgi:hypothetical protein